MKNDASATSSWPPNVEAASASNRVDDAEPVEPSLLAAPLRALVAAEGRGDRDDREHRDLEDLDDLLPALLRRRLAHGPGNTLIARATTRIAVISEITDSDIIAIFAHVRTGSVSVGLNAVAFVNER